MTKVRWYNRVAAWVWGWLCDPIQTLAIPVWQEEAERDIEEMLENERRAATYTPPENARKQGIDGC